MGHRSGAPPGSCVSRRRRRGNRHRRTGASGRRRRARLRPPARDHSVDPRPYLSFVKKNARVAKDLLEALEPSGSKRRSPGMSWKPIIVGVDASPEAADAAVFAVAAAQRAETSYHLVHATSGHASRHDSYPYTRLYDEASAQLGAALGSRVPKT